MGYASDAGKNPETEQHKHTYTQPIYAKVHHEEIGHMETVTDPPTYIGTTVPHGRGNSHEDYLNNGGWDRSCKNKNVTTKIVTVSVCSPGATWNKWIVDKKAYDEQVIVGYKCSCGEWKLVTN